MDVRCHPLGRAKHKSQLFRVGFFVCEFGKFESTEVRLHCLEQCNIAAGDRVAASTWMCDVILSGAPYK